MVPKHRRATHPGQLLRTEFLEPLHLSQAEVARKMGVSFNRLNEVVTGKRRVTVDTARRLGKVFKTIPTFWLMLQTYYDLGRR